MSKSVDKLKFQLTAMCIIVVTASICIKNIYAHNIDFETTRHLLDQQQQFHPLIATHGVVSTQEKNASKVGLKILEQGGNAVDAAVAVGYALAVTMPRAGNLGGGGFMLVWNNKKHKSFAINYRIKAPKLATKNMFLDKEGNIDNEKLFNSYLSSGTPGTVAGLNLAHKTWGKLPFSQVIQPAIDLAKNGIKIYPSFAQVLANSQEKLSHCAASKAIFFHKSKPLKLDDILIQKDLAKTLVKIQKNGDAGFYQGSVAHKISEAMHKNNGLINKSDLYNYKAEIVNPIQTTYKNYKIISMPPPSAGGIIISEILNILENFPLHNYQYNSANYYHLLCETMNLAYHDRNTKLGDPKFIDNPIKQLLDKNYAKKLAKFINLDIHTAAVKIEQQKTNFHESKNTTHFVIIDKDGNMVSNTYTLNYSFGSGIIVPGTGVFLNNGMDDFSVKPNTKNAFGLKQNETNAIAPNKQPLSSMSPTIVLDTKNRPVLATGTPGGARIISMVSQIILNDIDHNLNIATNIRTPRIHCQLWPDVMFHENNISPDTLHLLENKKHKLQNVGNMGSAQSAKIIYLKQQGTKKILHVTADPRRQGATAYGY